MWVPASAGMTNRNHQIQVSLNLVASLAITATIQGFSDSLSIPPELRYLVS
jgi:hypothetical protein